MNKKDNARKAAKLKLVKTTVMKVKSTLKAGQACSSTVWEQTGPTKPH
jgi:hypothetical protein